MAELNKSLTAMDWLAHIKLGLSVEPDNEFSLTENTICTQSSAESDCHTEITDNEIFQQIQLNSDGKPAFSYAHLITSAIQSSKNQRMTLSEIYQWICDNFSYYRDAGNGWKNSVRHNLSLSKAFVRVPRAKDDPGKGSYWCLSENVIDVHRTESDKHHNLRSNCFTENNTELVQNIAYHKNLERAAGALFSNDNSTLDAFVGDLNSSSTLMFQSGNNFDDTFECFNKSATELEKLNSLCAIDDLSNEKNSASGYLDLSSSFRRIYATLLDDVNFEEHLIPTTNSLPSISSCMRTSETTNSPGSDKDKSARRPGKRPLPPSSESDEEAVMNDEEEEQYLSQASARVNGQETSFKQRQQLKESLKQTLSAAVSFDWSNVNLSDFPGLAQSIKQAESSFHEPLSIGHLYELQMTLNKALGQLKRVANTSDSLPIGLHEDDPGEEKEPGTQLASSQPIDFVRESRVPKETSNARTLLLLSPIEFESRRRHSVHEPQLTIAPACSLQPITTTSANIISGTITAYGGWQ